MTLELLISHYHGIEWRNKKENDWAIAVVFGDIPILLLNRVPDFARNYIEGVIESVLEHEEVGWLLEKVEQGLHTKFDRVFPHVEDMHKLRKGSWGVKVTP